MDGSSMHQDINRQIFFVKRPIGMPDESCFKLTESAIPQPMARQLLLQTKYLSVDPYMRSRMNDRRSYVAPFQLNEVLSGGIVGEVIESRSENFVKGDFVTGNLGWQDYSVAGEKEVTEDKSRNCTCQYGFGSAGNAWSDCVFRVAVYRRAEAG